MTVLHLANDRSMLEYTCPKRAPEYGDTVVCPVHEIESYPVEYACYARIDRTAYFPCCNRGIHWHYNPIENYGYPFGNVDIPVHRCEIMHTVTEDPFAPYVQVIHDPGCAVDVADCRYCRPISSDYILAA